MTILRFEMDIGGRLRCSVRRTDSLAGLKEDDYLRITTLTSNTVQVLIIV